MSTARSNPIDTHAGTRSVLHGLSWTYVSIVMQAILKFGVLVALARLLSPRDFGLLAYALLCASFIERLGQAGVGSALVQVREFDADSLRTAHVLSVLSGIIGALGVWLVAPSVAQFFAEEELLSIVRVLSVGTLIEACGIAADATLQRHLRFKELTVADNIPYLVSMGVVATILASLGFGVWALVWGHLVLKVMRTVIVRAYAHEFRGGVFLASRARELVRVGLGFGLARILNFFSLQGDNFVVGRLLGTEALGLYSRGYQLMTLPAMYVGQLFERVMFPAMARQQDELDRLRRQFMFSLEAISLVTIPTAALMYVCSTEIVLVVFGERWLGMVPVFSILAGGVFFRTAYKCSDTLARSVGAAYSYAARQALYTFLIVVGASVGAWTLGLSGVAYGVVLALLLNYLSMTRLSQRILGLSWRAILRAHTPGLALGVCVGVSGWLTRDWVHATIHQPLLVMIVAGLAAAATGAVWLVGSYHHVPSVVTRETFTLMSVWWHRRRAARWNEKSVRPLARG